ncbi:hypothetical protein DR950_13090 [Kitasatospora xanthocidica]|uniref:Uncharacterized protein n=1 Tax=Kitasatospora xanthocidica TaxID=83382 RepID=A0A372ZTS3_9ACTN|nr:MULTISPECIES: hypothetical protein [Streptomycetaceae]OKI07653.1 hypothetical protein AMK13_13930 [Streptomyces sp. CB02056]RGD58595.1 hypothetical protein DR950_13090 [Kitasatospora xanthocidica]
MDPIISCRWQDPSGEWALTVGHNGDAWELLASAPSSSESIPFANPDEVRRLAQALLDLPAEPEPYEFEWQLSRSGPAPAPGGPQPHFATFAVGLDPTDDHRPYLAYQSYYDLGRATGLGLEVICEDPPVDHLRAQAHAFLTTFSGPTRR